jgi:hypothetical protein
MEQARRESMAAQQEASRLADEAEAAQHRTMNQSVIAEEVCQHNIAHTICRFPLQSAACRRQICLLR